MRKMERENLGTMKQGQDLVIVGHAGLAGTRVIVEHHMETLQQWFSREYLKEILRTQEENQCESKDLEYWKLFGATECEPAGEGGIFKTLWNLSGAYGTGISFTLRQIPIKQETVEICERWELNPYRLYSKGCYLLVADNGGQLVDTLVREGMNAKVIGRASSTIAREILSEDGRGFLDRPQADELKKVVKDYVFI